MPTAYYKAFPLIVVDTDGGLHYVPSETINAYNVTAASSLGTLASDADGIIAAGSFTANVGDVVRFYHSTYPGEIRLTLRATSAEAFTDPEGTAVSLVLENQMVSTTASPAGQIYLTDTAQPDVKPIYLGNAVSGTTTLFPYQSSIAQSVRVYAISQDELGRASTLDLAFAEYADVSVPALAPGTVTSVAMSVPSFLSVSGSPITTSGTLAVTLATQTAKTFFAGPTSGGAATPTFRSIVAADLGTGTANSTTFLRGDLTWQTVSTSLAIGNAVSGGGANRVLYEDGSQNLASDADFTFDGTTLKVGNATTSDQTTLKFDHTGGYGVSSHRAIDWESGGTVYSRIANHYLKYSDAGNPGLSFFTGGDTTNFAFQLKGDKTAVFGGSVSLSSGLTVTKSGADVLTVTETGAAGSWTGMVHNWTNGAAASNDEYRIDFKAGGSLYCREAMYYDGSIVGLAFYTHSNTTTPVLKLGSPTGTQIRVSYDGSNYMTLAVSSTGGVTFDAVGSGAGFTFSDAVTVNGSLTLSAQNIVTDTSTGMKIGTGTTQKLGFFNATPVVQRSDYGLFTDSTSGAVSMTLYGVSSTLVPGDGDTINDNFASINDQFIAIRAVLRTLGFMA